MEWMEKYSERERELFLNYYKEASITILGDNAFAWPIEGVERWLKDDEGTMVNIQCYPREGMMYVDGVQLHVPSYLEKIALEKVASKTVKTTAKIRL